MFGSTTVTRLLTSWRWGKEEIRHLLDVVLAEWRAVTMTVEKGDL